MLAPLPFAFSPRSSGSLRAVFSLAGTAMARVHTWIERARQRRQLGSLSDHMLKDMGVTREQIERELAKPFWRP